jgi:hypothetical protein
MENMKTGSRQGATGNRSFLVSPGGENAQPPRSRGGLWSLLSRAVPNSHSREVNQYRRSNFRNVLRGVRPMIIGRAFGVGVPMATLHALVRRGSGEIVDLGLISTRVVTDLGVGFIVDAFQNLVEVENMKYHGFGTGTTAEAASQTALVTELTTQYATDNTRPTGSTTEGASGNIFRTIGTLSPDASVAITEHGVFSQAATGGGVMIDRSVFSAINLDSVSSLQVTYDLTFPSGG